MMCGLLLLVVVCLLPVSLCANVGSYLTTNAPYKWEERWFHDMPIDHFSFVDSRTFNIRYLVNAKYWKPGQPIFFYCGNEGDIEQFASNTGLMFDLAPRFQAMIVFAEHRYYGKTQPFGNQSYSSLHNLGYLTSTQALADYSVLLTHIKGTTPGAKKSPVIAFGGSYGGMLAAWMRIKYPHVIDGALAASAPVLQFSGYTPCWVYNDIVSRTFRNSGSNCVETMRNVWSALRRLAQTEQGRTTINSAMRLCPDSRMTTEQNVTTLVEWLYGAFSELPMIDYPYETSFLAPVPAWPVKEACKYLTNPKQSDEALTMAVHGAINVYQNYTGKAKCFDIRADTSGMGIDGWNFQACTSMVMPMCTNDSETQLFEPSKWDLKSFMASCAQQFYGARTQPYWAMVNYGADHLRYASNIIFSNGYLDPWSGGGVLKLPFKHPSVQLIMIKQGAHHYDLRGANPKDTKEIQLVRKMEAKIVQKWVMMAKRRAFYDELFKSKRMTERAKNETRSDL